MNEQTIPFPPDHYLTQEKAHEWSLLLSARGISHSLVNAPHGWSIFIALSDEEKVRAEVSQYEEENVKGSTLKNTLPFKISSFELFLPFGLLIIFHIIVVFSDAQFHWRQSGHASNVAIIKQGQWWRVVTALTLHTDSIHLMSNVILGAVIASALLRQVGAGIGWFLILASGMGGNFINAFFRDHVFASIGASTAVFGSVGIVVGLQLLESQRVSWSRVGILMAAALALLGFLGAGEDTDIGAHFFGFATGILLGILTSVIFSHMTFASKSIQSVFALISLMIIAISWFYAFPST